MLAALTGHLDMVDLLLSVGAEVNSTNAQCSTSVATHHREDGALYHS